ncbi:MAG: protein TolQ [Candidatus Dadabacteria bacterium]|nr:MAG: protein TolQ [Candidatus Dadabacteria bacterium]
MTPTISHPGVVDMISGSGPVVQSVLYLLILISVASWAVILFKAKEIRTARKGSEKFVDLFWETRNLTEVAKHLDELPDNPVGEVFRAGYQELVRLRNKKKTQPEAMSTELSGVANVERAMRRAASLQRTRLEKMLTFLGTVASTAPFIGLFGTVWGIMNSFRGLSVTKATALQAVAPGISEALIATAMGLAAAIPALVAYNHFSRQARVMAVEMDNFLAEFLNIAERHFLV